MKYGLSEEQLAEIIAFIKGYPEVEEAILFGSRAIDTYKEASDIDIAIKGEKVTAGLAATIKFDLEEDTFLPFFFDVLAYPSLTNRALIEHIDNKGVRLFGGDVGGEWVEYKLGDVLEIKYGKDHKKLNDGIIPVYGSGGIMRYADTALYDEESILIPRKGTLNNIFYLNKPFWTVDTLFYTKPNKSLVNIKFLYYQLSEIDFNALNVGSAVPSLTVSVLNDVLLYLPELPEQKAIANVLSSLDDKIDLLHRQNKTLEAMAETLFRQWFIEEAKEDWEEKSLGEILTITSSKRIFYSEYVAVGIPFYRSKEIIELHNTGNTKSELCISENRFNEIQEKFGVPKAGDILLTSVGTLGIPYRVKKDDKFYFKDGNLTWFKDFDTVPSIVIYCWLQSDVGIEQLNSITIGSTQAALTISGMKGISLLLPPKAEMQLLEKHLMFIYDKVDANQSQIQTLEKLRDNLLPKLMSGEVRVAYDQQDAA